MQKKILSIYGLGALAVILILVNGISKTLFTRAYVDLTADKLYSLSDGTKRVLEGVQEPITVKFYFSRTDGSKYPAVKLYGNRVLDLLREYERIARGKLILETYDPRPDSEDAEWAEKYGLTPIPTRGGEELFLGLAAVNSIGDEQVIPVFNFGRQEFLEYDITKMLYGLINTKKPVVGLLSSIDVTGGAAAAMGGDDEQAGGWFFYNQLTQVADVRVIMPDITSIDKDVDLFVVIHPKNLPDPALYALDQYVMRGGKLLVFEDPFCQADSPPQDPQNPMAAAMADRSSDLNKLLEKWGVILEPKKVIADLKLATKIDTGRGEAYKNFLLWLSLRRDTFNQDDIVTSALENVILPWPGALKVIPPEGASIQNLFTSSDQAQLAEESQYRFNGGDPDQLLKSFMPSGETYPIAVRIRGKLKSNFPNGKPQTPEAQKKPEEKEAEKVEASKMPVAGAPEHLSEAKTNANVVVVADVDFISNRYSVATQRVFGTRLVSLLNDNQNFAQNVVENLLGSDDLISIRSRGQFSRPFERVEAMEIAAQQRFQQEELVWQAKLNSANQRLSQLQSTAEGKPGEKQVFSSAVLQEIKQLRDERKEAQRRLREVKRDLRQDIEHLGSVLFMVNTFFVPIVLILVTITYYAGSRRKRAA